MGVAGQPEPFYKRLQREITWLLALKLLALIVIYNAFFSAAHKAKITPQSLNMHLLNIGEIPSERKSP